MFGDARAGTRVRAFLRLRESYRYQGRVRLARGWDASESGFGVGDGVPGLPKGASLHLLRPSHASLLIADGVDIATVSARLGHSSVRTTQEIYAHMITSQDEEAARKWEEFQEKTRVILRLANWCDPVRPRLLQASGSETKEKEIW